MTDSDSPWQIEIDRGAGEPAEYLSIKALKLAGSNMVLVLPNGETVTFQNKKIRKVLVMRTRSERSSN